MRTLHELLPVSWPLVSGPHDPDSRKAFEQLVSQSRCESRPISIKTFISQTMADATRGLQVRSPTQNAKLTASLLLCVETKTRATKDTLGSVTVFCHVWSHRSFETAQRHRRHTWEEMFLEPLSRSSNRLLRSIATAVRGSGHS